MKWLFQFDRGLAKVELFILSIFLLSMVTLYSLQTILRNVFDTALLWIDPLVYNMLLWIALIGGSLATQKEKNISIDVTTKLLPKNIGDKIMVFTNVAAAIGTFFIASAALDYIHFMREDGMLESDYLPLQLWVAKIILPIGFYLISLRFAIRAIERVCLILGLETGQESKDEKKGEEGK